LSSGIRARAGPSTSFEPVCVSFLLFFFFLVNVIFLIWEKKKKYNGREEEETTLRRAEEEEEKGERRGCEGSRGGYGAFKARAEQVVDGIGVASQGCFCHACASEIEWDGTIFLFICQYRESGCA
jgi:hypothetical protein